MSVIAAVANFFTRACPDEVAVLHSNSSSLSDVLSALLSIGRKATGTAKNAESGPDAGGSGPDAGKPGPDAANKERLERLYRIHAVHNECSASYDRYIKSHWSLFEFYSYLVSGENPEMRARILTLQLDAERLFGKLEETVANIEKQLKLGNDVIKMFKGLRFVPSEHIQTAEELFASAHARHEECVAIIKRCDDIIKQIDKELVVYRDAKATSATAVRAGKIITSTVAFAPLGLLVWGVSSLFEARYENCIRTWEGYRAQVDKVRAEAEKSKQMLAKYEQQQPSVVA